jgi:enoyl-CoA hydratase/carnithine racemase
MSVERDPRIELETADGVAWITIRRPEAKNALTKAMYAGIRDACRQAEADSSVECVVLRGSGGAFAVGGDLKEMLDALENDPARLLARRRRVPSLLPPAARRL